MNLEWSTVKRRVKDLIPYEYNARKIAKKDLDNLKKSLQKWNLVDIPTININDVLISGHQRLKTMLLLGRGEELIDVRIPNRLLTDIEVKELLLLANTHAGSFDFEMIEEHFLDVFQEIDFEIGEVVAFNINKTKKENFNIETEIKTQIKRGDIIEFIGNGRHHRLYCEDSLNKENVEKFISGHEIDVLFTDPPYDMQMGGRGYFGKSMSRSKKRLEKLINFDVYLCSFFKELPINSFYIFTSKNGIPHYFQIFKDFGFKILTWCKTNPTPLTNMSYLPDIEYLMYFHRKGRIFNKSLKPTSIYKSYFLSSKEEGKKDANDDHPTIKPLDLITPKLLISSKENGNVLDLFGGSGSTMASCHGIGRDCFMMEYEPKYCQVIINRMKQLDKNLKIKINGT